MTQEEYRRMQMQKQAAPLSNQVFQPVQVTQVPSANYQVKDPDITPQQQQPGVGQQFGQALATRMITKGVDAVTGLPIMSTIFAEKGTKVPSWKEYQKMQGSMGTPYGKEKAKDWYIDKSKEQMNVAPSSSPSPSYAKRGEKIADKEMDMPTIWHVPSPVNQPRRPAPIQLAQSDWDDDDDVTYTKVPGGHLEHWNNSTIYFPSIYPPEMSTLREAEERLGYPYILTMPGRHNKGGKIGYAEEGMRVRAPLAKPAAIDKGTPGLTHPKGTTHGEYWSRGAPGLTHPAGTTRDEYWKDGNQFIKMDTSPNRESWWQKAERTGLFAVPGTQNVYVDPGKGTIAYQREDVKPFTWAWNKGRDFLGFGAPLAERSE